MRGNNRQSGKKKRIVSSIKTAKSRISDLNESRQDYSIYRFSLMEWIEYIILYLLLDGCISYLFFCSWIAAVLLLPGIVLFFREIKDSLLKERKKEIKNQFMDGIQMMAASLQAGYSVENAMHEALMELQKIYEVSAVIVSEFQFMEVQMTMSRSIEELFLDFGRRTGIEDIQIFSEVFLTAKRSGGDLLAVIRNTVSCIEQKQETMQEIETCLAGKVMEQNIMSLIPILILAYIKLSSPEFIDIMYGNLVGEIIMSICFMVYVFAFFWGRSIVRIEV